MNTTEKELIKIYNLVYTIEVLMQMGINKDILQLSYLENDLQVMYNKFDNEILIGADLHFENNPPPSYIELGANASIILEEILGKDVDLVANDWVKTFEHYHVNCGYVEIV